MQTFKFDIMTVLVLIVIVGVVLTMGLGHLNGATLTGAAPDNQAVMNVESSTGSTANRFINASGENKSPATPVQDESRI